MSEYVRKDDVLFLIEEIKCNNDIPKNYGTLLDIMRKIREMPALDLESVIEQLEKEKEESYYKATSKGGRGNGKSIAYGENLAYQKALEILKYAANATNNKTEVSK